MREKPLHSMLFEEMALYVLSLEEAIQKRQDSYEILVHHILFNPETTEEELKEMVKESDYDIDYDDWGEV